MLSPSQQRRWKKSSWSFIPVLPVAILKAAQNSRLAQFYGENHLAVAGVESWSTMPSRLKCEEVWWEISNYLEGAVSPERRHQLEQHFAECRRCKAILDGTINVVNLAGDPRAFPLPAGAGERMRAGLEQSLECIPLGITEDRVRLGSHLIYFWENDEEFRRGVTFLNPGLGKGEHCIAFGHDEALQRVLQALKADGFDPDDLGKKLQLTILTRRKSAQETLSDVSDVVHAALRAGARSVRFLGNLGIGRDPLPAGEDDVLELECRATALISPLPCVIVCMYDVRTLSGKLIFSGGLRSHHLAVCSSGVFENPYYTPELLPGIDHAY
jgi:MEDS: MEthanogen/methylotroph, DcmR Sensory domain/Putative zinc-finger